MDSVETLVVIGLLARLPPSSILFGMDEPSCELVLILMCAIRNSFKNDDHRHAENANVAEDPVLAHDDKIGETYISLSELEFHAFPDTELKFDIIKIS
ncbi:Ribosome-recycling factor [Dirofilaria immitis]